jgi:hypothetical protein
VAETHIPIHTEAIAIRTTVAQFRRHFPQVRFLDAPALKTPHACKSTHKMIG